MNLEEAKTLLSGAVKSELRDHAFGDCEVTWWDAAKPYKLIAEGYFGGAERSVSFEQPRVSFKDAEADELRKCFSSQKVERNDETGPDEFVVGQTMPGLTLEGVRRELEGE